MTKPSQNRKPCGRRFCPAAIRVLHPVEDLTLAQIGAALGTSANSVSRQSDKLGLPMRYADHYKKISRATLRDLYEVKNLPGEDIAAALGVAVDTVWRKAKAFGLRRPAVNNYRTHIVWPAEFDQMWLDNVLMADIFAAAKTELVDHRIVAKEAKRRGLPSRQRGGARWAAITIEQWQQIRLARAMAKAARIEQAAMINAEMVDDQRRIKRALAAGLRGAV